MKKNSRKIWVVSPFIYIYSAVVFTMAFISLYYDFNIFLIEIIFAVISTGLVVLGNLRFNKYISSIISRTVEKTYNLNEEYLNAFSIPVVVVGNNCDIVWYNSLFENEVANKINVVGHSIKTFVNGMEYQEIRKEKSFEISYEDKKYIVFSSRTDKCTILYYKDITYYKGVEKSYEDAKPVILTAVIDNRDEIEKLNRDDGGDYVILTAENHIKKWALKYNGMFSKVSNNRYVVILQNKEYLQILEEKLSILEEVKQLKDNQDFKVTMSIGIGVKGESYKENELRALDALDMALSRGGDQAVVKSDEEYKFYGMGSNLGIEKNNEARIKRMTFQIKNEINKASNVLVMGHKNSDLDSVGASIGIWGVTTRILDKPCQIVINKEKTLATPLIDLFENEGFSSIFINEKEALDIINEKTLLIIVDTHIPPFLESESIYSKCKNIVVIDHHRKMANYITNAQLFYHSPHASSACEMIVGLIKYMGINATISKFEAHALLSGIMLDTKNFVLKTSVKTFEAAAYLKSKGADTVEVKRMFTNTIDVYKTKYQLVSSAETYNSCAIASYTDNSIADMRVTAAQAADELLSLQDIKASFVMYSENGNINISARSLGDINVQVIMESLGGGGHQTMAGAQIDDCTIEQAREKLIKIISEINI